MNKVMKGDAVFSTSLRSAYNELDKHFKTTGNSGKIWRRNIIVSCSISIKLNSENIPQSLNMEEFEKEIQGKIFSWKLKKTTIEEMVRRTVKRLSEAMCCSHIYVSHKFFGKNYEKYRKIKEKDYISFINEKMKDFDAKIFSTESWEELKGKLSYCGNIEFYHKRYYQGKHLLIILKDSITVPKKIAGMVIGKGGSHIKKISKEYGKPINVEVKKTNKEGYYG